MSDLLPQLNAEMTGLIARARASVVRVSNGPSGAGAGTIWSSEGLIVTNAHVVHQATPRVSLPGEAGPARPARVLAYEPALDLALLSVPASGLPALDLGDARDLRAGPAMTCARSTQIAFRGLGSDVPTTTRRRPPATIVPTA